MLQQVDREDRVEGAVPERQERCIRDNVGREGYVEQYSVAIRFQRGPSARAHIQHARFGPAQPRSVARCEQVALEVVETFVSEHGARRLCRGSLASRGARSFFSILAARLPRLHQPPPETCEHLAQ